MANYIDNALVDNEKVLYIGHISLWSLSGLMLSGLATLILVGFGLAYGVLSLNGSLFLTLVTLLLASVGAVLWVIAFIKYKSTELAITDKRVIAKFGFIRRETTELNAHKVESIQVNQGILGRIFNYGTLIISGAGDPQAPIPGISSPLAFRRAFMELQDSITPEKE